LRARTQRLGLDVDAATRGSIYLDGNVLDRAGLEREAEARRRTGFEVELLAPAELRRRTGIARRHALLGFGNYTADPRRMAAAYMGIAARRGAKIYAPKDASEIDPSDSGFTIGTTTGCEIQAAHALCATGYEMPKGVPAKRATASCQPGRSRHGRSPLTFGPAPH
jgi:hypothetical protein